MPNSWLNDNKSTAAMNDFLIVYTIVVTSCQNKTQNTYNYDNYDITQPVPTHPTTTINNNLKQQRTTDWSDILIHLNISLIKQSIEYL